MKLCSVDGCENKMSARGLCPKHYYRNKTYGDPNTVRFPWREDRSCSIPNCPNEHEAKGYCKVHYLVMRKFKISHEDYVAKLSKSNGKCDICKKECAHGKALSLDHDHDTNKIRGMLCAPCNLALGGFTDSVEVLQSAINYLNYWGKQ